MKKEWNDVEDFDQMFEFEIMPLRDNLCDEFEKRIQKMIDEHGSLDTEAIKKDFGQAFEKVFNGLVEKYKDDEDRKSKIISSKDFTEKECFSMLDDMMKSELLVNHIAE